jgi:eukaryotic-like serine/threonine-protein kinase
MSNARDEGDVRSTHEAARWGELHRAFGDVVAADAARRELKLAELGRTDPKLRAELEELLAADAWVDERLARLESLLGNARAHDDGAIDVLAIVGRTIGHYQVLDPIATGGMGVVYRAHDTQLDRAVALKFPLPHRRARHDVAQRFRREARAAAALDHPNICAVYGADETDDGQLYLVMALYEGETLKARIARATCLPVADALAIAERIAGGLAAAHRAGIVHRDLKPANIMLLGDGGVKVLDFGLARMEGGTRTDTTAMTGTVAYMAPEQISSDGADLRADLWALGVVLYEMLTGARPFEHEHAAGVMHAVLHGDVVPPSTLRPQLPGALDNVVLRLLSRDPAARFGSADDVISALASVNVLAAQDESPKPARGRAVRARTGRTRVFSLRAAAIVAVPMALFAGFAAWLARPAIPADQPMIIAVLPFTEQPDDDDAYLGTGIADALATYFSSLPSATVTGGRVIIGEAVDATAADVARRRGADVVVFGAVERSGDSVRVSVTLFEVARQRSEVRVSAAALGSLPDLQASIARETASALRLDGRRVILRTRSTTAPTTNAEAWDLYLRGRAVHVHGRGRAEALQQALSYYAMARELDPGFALARARLAEVHAAIALRGDTTAARREQARLEAEAALRTDPGLAEAHAVLSTYWSLNRELEHAAEAQQRAVAAAQNRPDLRLMYALRLRNLGRWEEAATQMEHAIRLDPHNVDALGQAALTFGRMRRYRESIGAWDRLIALQPDNVLSQLVRGHNYFRLGIIDSLAATLERIPPDRDDSGMTTYSRLIVLRTQRRYDEALATLDSARHAISRDGLVYRPVSLLRASVLTERGDHASALPHYRTALDLLEDTAATYPRDTSIRIALAAAYAGLGRTDDAVREARTAMQHAPFSDDNPNATAVMGGAVEVFIRAGRHDDALHLIELLLSMPAGREISIPLLRIEPLFDPLRSDPRFEQLIRRFSRP